MTPSIAGSHFGTKDTKMVDVNQPSAFKRLGAAHFSPIQLHGQLKTNIGPKSSIINPEDELGFQYDSDLDGEVAHNAVK